MALQIGNVRLKIRFRVIVGRKTDRPVGRPGGWFRKSDVDDVKLGRNVAEPDKTGAVVGVVPIPYHRFAPYGRMGFGYGCSESLDQKAKHQCNQDHAPRFPERDTFEDHRASSSLSWNK